MTRAASHRTAVTSSPTILCVERSRAWLRVVTDLTAELGLGCVTCDTTIDALTAIHREAPTAIVAVSGRRVCLAWDV